MVALIHSGDILQILVLEFCKLFVRQSQNFINAAFVAKRSKIHLKFCILLQFLKLLPFRLGFFHAFDDFVPVRFGIFVIIGDSVNLIVNRVLLFFECRLTLFECRNFFLDISNTDFTLLIIDFLFLIANSFIVGLIDESFFFTRILVDGFLISQTIQFILRLVQIVSTLFRIRFVIDRVDQLLLCANLLVNSIDLYLKSLFLGFEHLFSCFFFSFQRANSSVFLIVQCTDSLINLRDDAGNYSIVKLLHAFCIFLLDFCKFVCILFSVFQIFFSKRTKSVVILLCGDFALIVEIFELVLHFLEIFKIFVGLGIGATGRFICI